MSGRVTSHVTMSLDGFVADVHDGCDDLFGWYDAGEVEVPTAAARLAFHLDPASAALMRDLLGTAGALVCGRRLFDLAQGWGGTHPVGAPVVVVSHRALSEDFDPHGATLVDDVPAAIAEARRLARDRDVVIASASIARQALELGLLDEVSVSLAPVVLGAGVPFLAGYAGSPVRLDDPEVVVGRLATHLRFAVQHP